MIWDWVLILTLIVGLLQLISGYITATRQTRIEETNKLTKPGKFVVAIMFSSAIITIFAQFIDNNNKQRESEKIEQNTNKIVNNTDRTNNPFSPFNLIVQISIPFSKTKNIKLLDSLKIIKDSIDKRFGSCEKFDVSDISFSNSLISLNLEGQKGTEILKEFSNKGRYLSMYFIDRNPKGLVFDSLLVKARILNINPFKDYPISVSYDVDNVKKYVTVDYSEKKFLITTKTSGIKVTTFKNKRNDLQGLIDLVDNYLLIQVHELDDDMELVNIRIETGKDFSKLLNMNKRFELDKTSLNTPDNMFYIHKFTKAELGYE